MADTSHLKGTNWSNVTIGWWCCPTKCNWNGCRPCVYLGSDLPAESRWIDVVSTHVLWSKVQGDKLIGDFRNQKMSNWHYLPNFGSKINIWFTISQICEACVSAGWNHRGAHLSMQDLLGSWVRLMPWWCLGEMIDEYAMYWQRGLEEFWRCQVS